MKHLGRFILLLALLAGRLSAAEDALIAAVRAADDERLSATRAADPARLDAIFSDALRYAHSNGKVEDKASFVQSLTSRKTIYESFDYQERSFTAAGPGVVLMTGRVIARAISAGQPVVLDLTFLAVWREEDGRWRFLAWQSCKNPPPVAKP
jgi:ketosteroid isomerase-like protein